MCPHARTLAAAWSPASKIDEVDAAFDQVRGGGEPDRAGTDDRDRKSREAVVLHDTGRQIEQGHSILQQNIDERRYLILHSIYRHLSISTIVDV